MKLSSLEQQMPNLPWRLTLTKFAEGCRRYNTTCDKIYEVSLALLPAQAVATSVVSRSTALDLDPWPSAFVVEEPEVGMTWADHRGGHACLQHRHASLPPPSVRRPCAQAPRCLFWLLPWLPPPPLLLLLLPAVVVLLQRVLTRESHTQALARVRTHVLPNSRTNVAQSLMMCARHRVLDPVPALQSDQDVGPGAGEAVRAGAAGVVGGDARSQSPARALAQVRQRRHEWAAAHGRPRVPQGELLAGQPERPWLLGWDRVCVCAMWRSAAH